MRTIALVIAVLTLLAIGVPVAASAGTVRQGNKAATLCSEAIHSGRPVSTQTVSNCDRAAESETVMGYRCPNGSQGLVVVVEPAGTHYDLHVGRRPIRLPSTFGMKRLFHDCSR